MIATELVKLQNYLLLYLILNKFNKTTKGNKTMIGTIILMITGMILILMSFLVSLQGSLLLSLGCSFFGLLALALPFILEY